jgi:hypothetical protein
VPGAALALTTVRTAGSPLAGTLAIVLLSAALAAGAFVIQTDVDLNLADEGHLWHVTARAVLGDVPLRDIRAYDPGRYYWGAVWFTLLGPGLIS